MDKDGKPRQRTFYRERRLLWKSKVEGTVTRNYDPGKYVWKAHKETPGEFDNFSELGEFLVDMTQRQWVKVSHMDPKMQHARMTTDGVVFSCSFPGCNKRSTSKISALVHETDVHYGVNILEEPERKTEVDEQIEKVQQDKRGPGRPRKASVIN